jgi:hypothetical protein
MSDKIQVSVRLSQDEKEYYEQLAKKEHRSTAGMISYLAQLGVKEHHRRQQFLYKRGLGKGLGNKKPEPILRLYKG